MSIVKVLVVPNDEGEKVGDNWLLASLGYSDAAEGDVYIVTNRVRASEYGYYDEIEALAMAKLCVDAINDAIAKRGSDGN